MRVAPGAAPALAWVHGVVIQPFADFLQRYKWHAGLILALIAVYRISDVVMGIMANPFYVDIGLHEGRGRGRRKLFGVVMSLVGAFLGGVLALRIGVMRTLMLGAILSAASNLLFAWPATRGHDLRGLVFVVSADNLSSGIASAAFVAYLSSLTNVQYSATQYALFSSLMLLFPSTWRATRAALSTGSATRISSWPPRSGHSGVVWCGCDAQFDDAPAGEAGGAGGRLRAGVAARQAGVRCAKPSLRSKPAYAAGARRVAAGSHVVAGPGSEAGTQRGP